MGVDFYVKSIVNVRTSRCSNIHFALHRSSSDTCYLGRIDTRRHCGYRNMFIVQSKSYFDIYRCNNSIHDVFILDV